MKKIFILDADSNFLASCTKWGKDLGMEIKTTVNPNTFLAFVNSGYDLLITGLILNHTKNGIDVLNKIRDNKCYDKIPFICIVATTLAVEGKELGFSAAYNKPNDAAEFETIVENSKISNTLKK